MSSSNGYNWNFEAAFQGIIDERSTTSVIFINGILTAKSGKSGFNEGKDANEKLNLTNHKNSIDFNAVYNPSSSPEGPGLVGEGLFKTYKGFHKELSSLLFQPALENWKKEVKVFSQEWWNTIINAKILVSLANSSGDFLKITDDKAKQVAEFIEQYGDWESFYKELNNNFSSDYTEDYKSVPNDLLEAFAQFMSDAPSKASESVNIGQQWLKEAVKFLEKNENNSLIIVAHSQGNYFIEDALRSGELDSYKSRIKVISLGSPTDYKSPDSTGFTISELYKNGDDPVTKLRLDGAKSSKDKLEQFLIEQKNIMSPEGVVFGLKGDHDLGKYLEREDVRADFRDTFESFNPKGYYFSPLNNPVAAQNTRTGWIMNGSDHDDFIEGSDTYAETISAGARNDVVHANGSNDTLIGGAG